MKNRTDSKKPNTPSPGKPRLLDRAREILRSKYYSRRTGEVYVGWMRRFILFHGRRHPRAAGGAEAGRAPASAMPALD